MIHELYEILRLMLEAGINGRREGRKKIAPGTSTEVNRS